MATASLPNPHHRKIELQSPLDLTHLQTQLDNSARQKLDLHFPPSAYRSKPATHISLGSAQTKTGQKDVPQQQQSLNSNEEETDPLRQHVQSLLDAFLSRTWSSAAQSITINGLDAHTLPQFTDVPSSASNPISSNAVANSQDTDVVQEIEGVHYTHSTYDSRLQTRLASLYGELESLTAQVSKLRREAPARGAEMMRDTLGTQIADEDEEVEQSTAEIKRGEKQQQDAQQTGMALGNVNERREGWYDDVKSGYEEAVGQLARLSGHQLAVDGDGDLEMSGNASVPSNGASGGGLTGCVGKVQRARTVAEELE